MFGKVADYVKKDGVINSIKQYRNNLTKATYDPEGEENILDVETEQVDAALKGSPIAQQITALVELNNKFYQNMISETDRIYNTYSVQDLYEKTVNTEDLKTKEEAANKIAGEIEELQQTIDNIEKDVREQFG